MREKRETFASEALLCAAFAEQVAQEGWTVYPETDGWDMLLLREGIQVGVEAKLRPNMGVLAQLAGRIWQEVRGPHYAALLVPYSTGDFLALARVLGALVIDLQPADLRESRWRRPLQLLQLLQHHPALYFDEPAWMPPCVPDVAAGVPCPVRLTAWKHQALRLIARLELRGYVIVADFQDIGLHTSRWYHFWLIPEGTGRPQRWVRKPGAVLADAQHPDVFLTCLEREAPILEAFDRRIGLAMQLPLAAGATA